MRYSARDKKASIMCTVNRAGNNKSSKKSGEFREFADPCGLLEIQPQNVMNLPCRPKQSRESASVAQSGTTETRCCNRGTSTRVISTNAHPPECAVVELCFVRYFKAHEPRPASPPIIPQALFCLCLFVSRS